MKHAISLCLPLVMFLAALPAAQAGTKEELEQLQSDILGLRKQILGFEKSFSERLEGLKTLVEQLNDQIAESNILFGKVSAEIEKLVHAPSADQAILQEMRVLSGKMDETQTRISALAQQLSELKVQSKPINQSMIQGGSFLGEDVTENTIYDQAFNDFIQGNFDLAIQGFIAYLSNFPQGEKAASAQYNIGEAYYNQNRMPQAVAAFTRVISDYPDDAKVASALFKRGLAHLTVNETEAATADFKDIIVKFPETPESGLAGAELERLGVQVKTPSKNTGRKSR